MARKSWAGSVESKTTPVARRVVQVVKAVVGPVLRSVSANVAHVCDPTGWRCDCARRAVINSGSALGKSSWIPKRKGWLK